MRVVFATVGSLGDVHPLLAIGAALRRMRVDVRFAATTLYAQACSVAGLEWTALGQSGDFAASISYSGSSLRAEDTQNIVERLAIDPLAAQVDALHAATHGADVLVAPFQLMAAQLAAELRNIPLASCVFSPAFIRRRAQQEFKTPPRWHAEVARVRRALGLPRKILAYTPFSETAAAVLGLFPDFLMFDEASAVPQLRIVGLPRTVGNGSGADRELVEFCREPNVVFSFGSYADACNPRHYFEQSIAACRTVGLKCVYLSQYVDPAWTPADRSDVLHRGYVPHDDVFPLASYIVHHGGLGTLVAACRHRKPMLIVPFLHDQPYHAERMRQLVESDVIPAPQYTSDALARSLSRLREGHAAMERRLCTVMAAADASDDAAERAAREICAVAGMR